MDAQEMKALYESTCSYTNVDVKLGNMSPRDRFFAIMDFKKYDRIIDCEFGYWNDTLRRWHGEGLPKEVVDNDAADIYFGFDVWKKHLPISTGIFPAFAEEIIEQQGSYTIKYDGDRVKCKVFTDGADTIPHYLDFPIKDRESYLPFKQRLLPQIHDRLPTRIEEIAHTVKNRNYILELFAGSTAGLMRNLMGFEGICLNVYMQPELIDEILNDLGDLYTAIAAEATRHLDVDLIAWWEDIAFKTGPIVPPDWFSEKCGTIYKRVMDLYHAKGTRFSFVDCDGDNRLLVPTWIDNGVNIVFPLEVNAGIHPQTLRSVYPLVRMMGGFDKVVLMQGKDAIKKELLRLKPIVDEGGFIPHVDHRVQADVAFIDYCYYLEAKRDIFGIDNSIRR